MRNMLVWPIRYAMILASCILVVIFVFSDNVVTAFTTDSNLIEDSFFALIFVFMMSPLIAVQMVGAGYFQAIGKALPALLLTMTKQGFFLIPLVLILPKYYGVDGIWYSFPIADVLSAAVTWVFLQKEIKTNLLFHSSGIAKTA